MSLLSLFRRRGSAPVARERLQILLSHERTTRGQSDLLTKLRDEILAVVANHVNVDRDQVRVTMERGDKVSMRFRRLNMECSRTKTEASIVVTRGKDE